VSGRIAYLDCVGGLAGDMLLGALLDAGASLPLLQAVPARLGLSGVGIAAERVERQGIGAVHVRVDTSHDRASRAYREIRELVEAADLAARVRSSALDAFARLADAEGRIHGVPAEDVHFHELGSLDTLIDVVGAFVLMDDLGVERVACSPLPYARGLTRAAHGVLPLPAPATLALLRGAPLVGVAAETELVTPTGAAIASVAVTRWGALPPLLMETVGYGAGTADLPDRPNVVRIVVGAEAARPTGEVVLLETNLDDLSPELVPDALERCFAAGALDVWSVPAQMKKGRPGIVLAALARPGHEAAVAKALFEETSALGVRVARVDRYELDRQERVVQVAGSSVRIKVGVLDGMVVNLAPEHDDCAAVAKRTGRTVKSIWAEALARAHER
jgi:uncharacterized protein (TIGR00299 family) protein